RSGATQRSSDGPALRALRRRVPDRLGRALLTKKTMTHSPSFSCILTPLIPSPFRRSPSPRMRTGGQGVRTQLERPGLRDERLAETVVPLLAHDPKPGRLVQPPGGGELALGPEHELAVARLAGEALAFVHLARAEALPPCWW